MKNSTKIILFLSIFSVILGFGRPVLAGVSYTGLYYNCNYHAYRDCVGSSVYWFDSCDNRQDIYQNCFGANQTCKYGRCIAVKKPAPAPAPVPAPTPVPEPAPTPAPVIPVINNFFISFLGKKSSDEIQWNKNIQAGPNSNVYFLVSISNNSNNQIDNVNVSADMPSEITYLGNLKNNDVLINGDIVSGVNIGSLAAGDTRAISFEGKTQAFNVASEKQAIITVSSGGTARTDILTINFNPSQQAAAVSSASEDSSFVKFLKRWYLWILAAIVLVFLFITAFRRFSTNG